MSILLRRRMLLTQAKKSSNLFNEKLLLKYTPQIDYITFKVAEGYEIQGYPVFYLYDTNELVNHFKNSIKPNVDYTISFEILSRGTASAGYIHIKSSSSDLIVVGKSSVGKVLKNFKLTQDQIDSINSIYIYGTSKTNIANGVSPTIISNIQLVEGVYTADTIPPYEPF